MSAFNEMVDLTNKLFYYLDTFEINGGRETAREILLNELKKNAVEEKIRLLRAKSAYEKGAREYYAKNGTQGEF